MAEAGRSATAIRWNLIPINVICFGLDSDTIYSTSIDVEKTGIYRSFPNASTIHTLRPRQYGRHFADDILTCIFFNENCCILIKFSLKYVRKGPIDNNPALVQIMAWCRSGDKPLSEPMMISYRRIYASLGLNVLITWQHGLVHWETPKFECDRLCWSHTESVEGNIDNIIIGLCIIAVCHHGLNKIVFLWQ